MSSSSMNKYWIPHLDIHKKVITQELQFYLGPQATVRPYTREVRAAPIPTSKLADSLP